MSRQRRVDLRKRHPYESDLRKAEYIAYLGTVVDAVAIFEFAYLGTADASSYMGMGFALVITAFSGRRLRKMRMNWPSPVGYIPGI